MVSNRASEASLNEQREILPILVQEHFQPTHAIEHKLGRGGRRLRFPAASTDPF